MKKILLALFVLILLIAAGLMIYITSIDWNKHKDKISEQFLAMTGKVIVFEGPVSLEILPSPYLQATNVKIYNQGAIGEKPLVDIKNLVANLSLGPLLQGAFDIKRMVLQEAQINVEKVGAGGINWQSPLSIEQRENLENEQIRLNSVSLVNATLNYEDPYRDIDVQLDNLNGEVVAQSIFGPYRVEGNYVKDNNPEGFALSVGKIADSFATTVNLVVSHPISKSYIRFDGSVMLGNNAINGNMIIESENILSFAKANFKNISFDKAYNYPLALTFDINTNDLQVDLNNIVIKYGETQGAGNVQIPLRPDVEDEDETLRTRLEMAFNFTNFNLDPIVYMVTSFINQHKDGAASFSPDWKFDIIADIKSLKSEYKGQPIKDFATSFDIVNNNINIRNLKATLPGDTDFKLNGDLYAEEGVPGYNMELSFNSNDFLKTLNWMGIEPNVTMASTYRKALGSAKFLGNMNKIQISPFNLTIDKSSLSGEAGLKLGKRNDAMLILNADMINFDNYIAQLPKEEQDKNWSQRMQYRFAKLGVLNDFEMEIAAKIDLCIYENMPFEKVDFKATLLNGDLDINRLAIGSVANANIDMSGIVKGFGNVPAYENLKYNLKTEDVAALINKFEFKAPNLDYKELKKFESEGIATGSLDKFAIKAVSKLENLEFTYGGQVTKNDTSFLYNGNLEVKHPDFVKMINSLNLKYNPEVYSLGAFNLKTKVAGNADNFRASPLDASIGFNSFTGDVSLDKTKERPNVLADLSINKLELERFMNNGNIGNTGEARGLIKIEEQDGKAAFLAKPFWDKTKFNFDFYKGFDLNAKFKISAFSYKKYALQDVVVELVLVNDALNMTKFEGMWKNGGKLESNLNLNMGNQPQISGRLKFSDVDVADWGLSGTKYGLISGKTNANLSFNSLADSQETMAKNFNGNLDFAFDNVNVKGWNLLDIYKDIVSRKNSEGLVAFIKNNLQKGNTVFNVFQGKMTFNNGSYSLADTSFKGSGVVVGVFGDGNISNWDMNVLFNVKYDEPQYLPGYSFSLKGPLDEPLIDVNISALYELYKSQQEKIINQEKAVEDERRALLQNGLDEQANTAKFLLEELQNNLRPELLARRDMVKDAIVLGRFYSALEQIDSQIKAVGSIVNSGQQADFDEALIAEMTELNKKETQNLEIIKKDLQKLYIDDSRSKIAEPFNVLVETYNNAKMENEAYLNSKQALQNRLAEIKTDYKWEDDTEIMGWEQFIEDKALALDGQNNPLLDRYNEMLKSEDSKALEEYVLSLEDLQVLAEEDMAAMQESIANLNEYALEKVTTEEEKYNNLLREEEIKRKLEENTGVISNKKTGKSVIVQRDIEEIEKAQELTEKEEIKVLDFSDDKSRNVVRKAGDKNPVKRRK